MGIHTDNGELTGYLANSSVYGKLNLLPFQQVLVEFCVIGGGAPRDVDLTVCDLDLTGPTGQAAGVLEQLIVETDKLDPLNPFSVSDNTEVEVSYENNNILFTATQKGSAVENPGSALDFLSDSQKTNCAELHFKSVSCFDITFATGAGTSTSSGARNFFYSTISALDVDSCGYSATLSPTSSSPSVVPSSVPSTTAPTVTPSDAPTMSKPTTAPSAVSYTHLTLPTIYSV